MLILSFSSKSGLCSLYPSPFPCPNLLYPVLFHTHIKSHITAWMHCLLVVGMDVDFFHLLHVWAVFSSSFPSLLPQSTLPLLYYYYTHIKSHIIALVHGLLVVGKNVDPFRPLPSLGYVLFILPLSLTPIFSTLLFHTLITSQIIALVHGLLVLGMNVDPFRPLPSLGYVLFILPLSLAPIFSTLLSHTHIKSHIIALMHGLLVVRMDIDSFRLLQVWGMF